MNERTRILRDTVRDSKCCLCLERATYYTESWKETAGKPIGIRRALAFKHVLDHQTVHILKGELVVGNQTGSLNAAPLFPEYGLGFLMQEIDHINDRKLDQFYLSEENARKIKELDAYWQGRTHFDYCKEGILSALPEQYREYYNIEASSFNGVFQNAGRMTSGDGHVIADYNKVLTRGLSSVIEEAKDEIAKCDEALHDPEMIHKKQFLQSVVLSAEAVIRFAHRYADEARRMADEETDPDVKKELLMIADHLMTVPEHPAKNFWQAVQSYWFVHMALQIESNGHSISFGRFDQYLLPFYEKDIANGTIDREGALTLIECLMIKCNQIKKIRAFSNTRVMHGYPMFQTMTIGGQTRKGEDAVNDVSYLTLDAISNIKLQEPTVITRIFAKTSSAYLMKCVETVVKHGGGLPGFFNDEVAIPLLMSTGVSLEDARDWAIIGCSEPAVPGKHNTILGGMCHLNLLKVLELALNDGYCDITDATLKKGLGTLTEFTSFEQVMEAYKRQLDFYISFIPVFDAIVSEAHLLTPCPFLSGIIDGRISYGHDVEEGKGPNYNDTLSLGHCSVNVGNALYAVKKAVFDDRQITLSELDGALKSNFAGEEGQRIQKILKSMPKYGNDDDEVDDMVRDTLNLYLTGISSYTPARGGHYCPSPQTLSANAFSGENVGASADGRNAGQPTADNVSPTAGTDMNGLTAVLNSVSKLDHALATNGTILNVKLHPTAVSGSERVKKLADLIRAYFILKGFQVQFNIVSTETLKDAQKHPENYKNLVVKVAGYSALFTNLDPYLQDQIIARTENVRL